MHDYNTILGVIELRLSKVSYDTVQKRYRIGRSGITLIMKRYNESGLSLDDLRQMPASKMVDLIYPKENLRHKDIPLPDFGKIHEQMVQMGKHADLSFLWIDYKKEHPNGYQLAQFYKLYRDFMVDTYGTSLAHLIEGMMLRTSFSPSKIRVMLVPCLAFTLYIRARTSSGTGYIRRAFNPRSSM